MKRRHADDPSICRRTPSVPLKRHFDVVYTDMFLDTLNYERDVSALHDYLTDSPELTANGGGKTLLVLSPPIHDTVLQNENTDSLYDGLCLVTTPSSFDRYTVNSSVRPDTFTKLVFFNVDPFVLSDVSVVKRTGRDADSTDTSPSVGTTGKADPFGHIFDSYVRQTDTKVARTTVTAIYNTFLMRTESVSNCEERCGVRICFSVRVHPVHEFDRDITLRTTSNFCTSAVSALETDFRYYTIGADKPVPSTRALGPFATERLLSSDSFVLLDVSSDRGGTSAADEYYRFKQFYYSLAHGRENKWGIRTADGERSHFRSWNRLLGEELERWVWILNREVEDRPTAGPSNSAVFRRKLMQVYTMSPCVLNVASANCRVLQRGNTPPRQALATASDRTPPSSTVGSALGLVLAEFDTSTFNVWRSMSELASFTSARFTDTVSINDAMVVENVRTGDSVRLRLNSFLRSLAS